MVYRCSPWGDRWPGLVLGSYRTRSSLHASPSTSPPPGALPRRRAALRPVVVDELDAVAVGIEHEGAVVAEVVATRSPGGPSSRSRQRRATRWNSSTEAFVSAGNAMWSPWVGAPGTTRERAALPRTWTCSSARSRIRVRRAARRARRTPARPRGPLREARGDRSPPSGVQRSVVDGLDAVAVRVEEERAVVVRLVVGALAGAPSSRSPRDCLRCQNASTCARFGATKPICRPRRDRPSADASRSEKSSHSTTTRRHRSIRPRACRAALCRSPRTHGGPDANRDVIEHTLEARSERRAVRNEDGVVQPGARARPRRVGQALSRPYPDHVARLHRPSDLQREHETR